MPVRRAPAHPRSRGEHFIGKTVSDIFGGSSPLARGTSTASKPTPGESRLIPARAGNIFSSTSCAHLPAAHPRSRGEHMMFSLKPIAWVGSSPLARGTSTVSSQPCRGSRLIPARAGNIRLRRARSLPVSAHPRSRGEHSSDSHASPAPLGSSPLARGTSTSAAWSVRGYQAHPRSRGEHAPLSMMFRPSAGSSPLARGTY